MAEEINFVIGHFRYFDGPVTLTLISDDPKNHMGVCLWEEILFAIEHTIRSLPSLSVTDLRAFELDEWCNLGQFWSPLKRHMIGDICQYSVCLWGHVLFSIEKYYLFFSWLLLILSRLIWVKMHSGPFLKSKIDSFVDIVPDYLNHQQYSGYHNKWRRR